MNREHWVVVTSLVEHGQRRGVAVRRCVCESRHHFNAFSTQADAERFAALLTLAGDR